MIKETTPRSYEVITEHGLTLRRNRRHLLKVPQRNIESMDNYTNNMTKQPNETKQPDVTILSEETGMKETKSSDTTLRERPKRQIEKPKRLIEEM